MILPFACSSVGSWSEASLADIEEIFLFISFDSTESDLCNAEKVTIVKYKFTLSVCTALIVIMQMNYYKFYCYPGIDNKSGIR